MPLHHTTYWLLFLNLRLEMMTLTRLILLPAWQFSDLVDFGTKAEMCKEDIKMRYYISGATLLDFCREETAAIEIADSALRRVASSSEAMDLLSGCGVGASVGLTDTIRRAYLKDRKVESQYMHCRYWTLFVDSGFLLCRLLRRCSWKEYEKLYGVTRAIAGALFGCAFEYRLHKKASSGGFCIEAQEYTAGKAVGKD